MFPSFLFATGIENSYPTVGARRVDQMAASDHYGRWREDFALVREIGIEVLRYGPPIHTTWRADGVYDWSFADETFVELHRLAIEPVADLCHFGVPDWVGNFQNPDFPALFARYAGAFAARFPWVRLYTPVNEMYVCAQFSGRYGWWNEQMRSDRGFVTALKHLVRANVLAMEAILKVRPDALFIQSESFEHYHPECPDSVAHAEEMNRQRFLSLDWNYGRPVDPGLRPFLLDNGVTEAELRFFVERDLRKHCIVGVDYYVTNEHRVRADGSTAASGEILGFGEIARQYNDRYRLPIMHTETNLVEGANGDESVKWLRKQWDATLGLRHSGVPVLGFTWYSLTDQVDWDTALREDNGRANPLGLFDLDRNIRAAGREYQRIVRTWGPVLRREMARTGGKLVPV